MSDSLLQLVKGTLDHHTKEQIGILLGASDEKTSSAIGVALPAILAGIVKKASVPDGAAKVFRALDDFDGGTLENMGALLGAGDHAGLLNSGSAILNLAWGSDEDSWFAAIANVVGMDRGAAATLSRLLGPIVMGVLGSQRRLQGLDVAGLKSLLISQHSNLAAAIPQELASQLGPDELLPAAPTTNASAPAVKAANSSAAAVVPGGGSALKVLLPLLIIVGVFWLAWQIWPSDNNHLNESVDASLDLPVVAQASVDLTSEVAISDQLNQTFGELTAAIKTVRDIDTAKAVMPQFAQANEMLDRLSSGIGMLPEGDGPMVGSVMGSIVQKLQQALESIYGYPGVREVVEPAATPLIDRLNTLVSQLRV